MSKVRKIAKNPANGKNYFIIDASFLANKFISQRVAPSPEKKRIKDCAQWWKEIDLQLENEQARVYIPDICIAETFKVLAKKYYIDKWFKDSSTLKRARDRLGEFVSTPVSNLRAAQRTISVHDISTTRDLIISVDRFYRTMAINKYNVTVPDLIVLATAKYLMDFFDIPKERLHIVTLDRALRLGCKKIPELHAYDPTLKEDRFELVFR